MLASFWDDWAGNDSVDMFYPNDCYAGRCNFSDASDGRVSVKAAATADGLYLAAVVTDDSWVDPGDSTGVDTLVLYFDSQSANDIFICTWLICPCPNSYCIWALRIPLTLSGDSQVVLSRQYDDSAWAMVTDTTTAAGLAAKTGGKVEIGTEGQTSRFVEMFIPWNGYCTTCLPLSPQRLAAARLAFSVVYVDHDAGDTAAGALAWLGSDPLANCGEANYFGDLVLPDTLTTTLPVNPSPARSAGIAGTRKAAHHYSLTGRLLCAGTTAPGVSLERSAAPGASRIRFAEW
jgi:hypothetical protein